MQESAAGYGRVRARGCVGVREKIGYRDALAPENKSLKHRFQCLNKSVYILLVVNFEEMLSKETGYFGSIKQF